MTGSVEAVEVVVSGMVDYGSCQPRPASNRPVEHHIWCVLKALVGVVE